MNNKIRGVALCLVAVFLMFASAFVVREWGNRVSVDLNLGKAAEDGGEMLVESDSEGEGSFCQMYMDGFNTAVQEERDWQKAVNLVIQAKSEGCKWVKTYSYYFCRIIEDAIVDSAGNGDTESVKAGKGLYGSLNCK